MITDVPGIRVGHWTGAGTGVTVVLAPAGSVGAAEVRGGAPATRESALLEHGSLVNRLDAVVLSGGSALGLAAADGVVGFLRERGQGFPTRGGPVPIVGAASIFDLVESQGQAPGPAEGREAAESAARGAPPTTGRVGAGSGATVGTWRGSEYGVPGGLGSSSVRVSTGDGVVVAALAVVNASGDVLSADGTVLAGSSAPPDVPPYPQLDAGTNPFENTTLAVVATDAALDKAACRLVAQSAHDGFARAIRPTHTRFDGDMVFVVATGERHVEADRVRVSATEVVAEAIRQAVDVRE